MLPTSLISLWRDSVLFNKVNIAFDRIHAQYSMKIVTFLVRVVVVVVAVSRQINIAAISQSISFMFLLHPHNRQAQTPTKWPITYFIQGISFATRNCIGSEIKVMSNTIPKMMKLCNIGQCEWQMIDSIFGCVLGLKFNGNTVAI